MHEIDLIPFKKELERLVSAIEKNPKNLTDAINALNGNDPEFPDIIFVSPEEKKYLIDFLSEKAMLNKKELMFLYHSYNNYLRYNKND